MRSRVSVLMVTLVCLAALPATAWAQNGTISGLVTDTTGGILPGVTVEAASPVLISGSVTAVSDGAGRYTVTNLRPGTYTVTFTLDGFNKLIREGVVLSGDARVEEDPHVHEHDGPEGHPHHGHDHHDHGHS